MKKTILLAVLLSVLPLCTWAQNSRFSVHADMGSMYNGQDAYATASKLSGKLAGAFDWVRPINSSSDFVASAALGVKSLGFSGNGNIMANGLWNKNYSFDARIWSLNLPVSVGVRLHLPSDRALTFKAGGYLDYNMAGTLSLRGADFGYSYNPLPSRDTKETIVSHDGVNYKIGETYFESFSFGVLGLVEYELSSHWKAYAEMQAHTKSLYQHIRKDVPLTQPIVVSLGMAYTF